MMRWMLLIALFVAPMAAQAKSSDCGYESAKMFRLSLDAFDQQPGGWRLVGGRKGCEVAAADLIVAYRKAYDGALTQDNDGAMLYWHEGQLRASAGQTERAITAMGASRKLDDPAWNLYVDATIAFLRRDRRALLAGREGMRQLPRPANFAKLQAMFEAQGIPTEWPLNIDVVEGLIGCFDQPYSQAYGEACRARFANE